MLRGVLLVLIIVYLFSNKTLLLTAILCFSTFLLLVSSELAVLSSLKSATPIVVLSTGVRMPVLYHERLRGLKRFIPFEDIDHVEIRRRGLYQMMMPRNAQGIRWSNAPICMVIELKNGRRYKSGDKAPGQILAVTKLLMGFGVPVKDSGVGSGGIQTYENGRPVK